MFKKFFFLATVIQNVSAQGTPFLCNSLNLTFSVFDHGVIALTGNFQFSVNFQENGLNSLTFTNLVTTFTKSSSTYYFESEYFVNPDFHFGQPFTIDDNGGYLISNDTVDLKFWFYVKKDLYFIPSYFIIDQGSISFQTGETIEQTNFGLNFPWNRTDIWNEDITTTIARKCLAYTAAPAPAKNRQCTRFTLTSHIYDTKNNNLLATISSKLNINGNLMDIFNDFTSTSNSKFAINVNFCYNTNYTKGSSSLSIPLNGNRKYIFMLNFEINDLTYVFEYLGKFIKRDNYYLAEEGMAFPDQSSCLSQKRLLQGSTEFQLVSFMCCFA